MGLFIGMMAKVFGASDSQRRFDETRQRMQEIKQAILGAPGAYINGQRQFTGYISDIGNLPLLNADGQPENLWKQNGLPDWEYQKEGVDTRIWCGWRGPYIEVPSGDVLKDSWGNAFKFSIADGDMSIISLGADRAEGGSGYDEDIELAISKNDYLAPVAGKIKNDGNVKIYLPLAGDLDCYEIAGLSAGDYFRFEEGATGIGTDNHSISIGIRSIKVGLGEVQVITVEPTGNWLGILE